jgi:hypothetical protein
LVFTAGNNEKKRSVNEKLTPANQKLTFAECRVVLAGWLGYSVILFIDNIEIIGLSLFAPDHSIFSGD